MAAEEEKPAAPRLVADSLPRSEPRLEELLEAAHPAPTTDTAFRLSLFVKDPNICREVQRSGMPIRELPFVAGRRKRKGTSGLHLSVGDDPPFRVSRRHFAIEASAEGPVVRDLGSTLGTVVNQQSLGSHFSRDAVPLMEGENTIVAGGTDSPCRFTVMPETDG